MNCITKQYHPTQFKNTAPEASISHQGLCIWTGCWIQVWSTDSQQVIRPKYNTLWFPLLSSGSLSKMGKCFGHVLYFQIKAKMVLVYLRCYVRWTLSWRRPSLPAEGIVSTTVLRSRFLFFGSLLLQSCSKWVCMGSSITRKWHCSRPLNVVAAISLT